MSYIVLPAQSRLALKHKQHSYLAGTPFFGYRVARNRLTSALEFLYVATPKGLFDLVKNEPITAFPSTGGYYKVDDTSSGIVGDALVPIGVTNKEFYSKNNLATIITCTRNVANDFSGTSYLFYSGPATNTQRAVVYYESGQLVVSRWGDQTGGSFSPSTSDFTYAGVWINGSPGTIQIWANGSLLNQKSTNVSIQDGALVYHAVDSLDKWSLKWTAGFRTTFSTADHALFDGFQSVFELLEPANDTPYLISIPGGGGAYSLTADTGGFAATGTAAGLIASRKLAADSQSYALGGQSANLVRSFALLAESGDFTVSGGAASLLADRALTAALGAYSLSGIDAGLTYTPVGNYSITADAGAFALTGAGAAILADRALAADAQSYALTGIDAALTYTPSGAYSLAADSGSFALTGAAVTLTYTPAGSYSMPADSVAFGVTGHDAGLLADRVNTAEAGSFALTGVDAALAYGYSMPAESAPFALTGVDAGFGRTYQLTAELGEFTLTGVAATLRYSAAVTMSGRVQLERGTLRSIRSSRTLRT